MACKGWTIQDMGKEGYAYHVMHMGPIWCAVHKQDAWLCFAPTKKSPFPLAGTDDDQA